MSVLTPERAAFHAALEKFVSTIPDGGLVYDVGRTHAYGYYKWFTRQTYRTIDRNPKAKPDILLDVETIETFSPPCDALVCNGVTESAANPYKLVEGCYRLMKPGAVALFGIRLLGYPLSPKNDYTRFTPEGAARLLESAGFQQIVSSLVYSEANVPSYAILDCVK